MGNRVIKPAEVSLADTPSPLAAAIQRAVSSAARDRGSLALLFGVDAEARAMAAEAFARAAKNEVLYIDLSLVVSKYIGETEKNLARVFQEAQDSHSLLFFDEAEALFGKRTDVEDAHDRYANLVINYLLQRVEGSTGLSILASNSQPRIDPAVLRRARVVWPPRFPEK